MRLLEGLPCLLLFSVSIRAVSIYEDVADLPSTSFDFIIAGGGNAGLVVANRLTENPKFNVLVIEAGPTHQDVKELQVPFFARELRTGYTAWDWNSTTVPQPGLNGRSILYLRGFVLGGCTSHNGMIWLRGSRDDYDRWAKVAGDQGWSWDGLLPYMKKSEKWTRPTDGHDNKGQFDPSVHGFKGLLPISVAPGYSWHTDNMVLKAVQELNKTFPFIKDPNSGNPIGTGWMQSSVGHGLRSSAATAYYDSFAHRPNLHVVVDTTVTRLLTESKTSKAFKKVEVARAATGARKVLTAKKEVIVSAGVVGTPLILLHSGIGDKNELKQVGVSPSLDLPDVGKHFHNHVLTSFGWQANTTNPNLDDPAFFAQALAQWNRDHTGPLGETGLHFTTGLRLPADSHIFKSHRDPSAGPNTPHLLLTFDSGNGYTKRPGQTIGMTVALVTPESRGFVTINSTNPFDPPVIDQRVLTSDFDIFTMRQGYLQAKEFFSASVWKGYVLDPIAPASNATEVEIEQFIRNTAGTSSHAVGTASISPANARNGVVNPDLLLKGAVGVRIVDGSVLPYTVAANTQAAIYALAERAADLIKAKWK